MFDDFKIFDFNHDGEVDRVEFAMGMELLREDCDDDDYDDDDYDEDVDY